MIRQTTIFILFLISFGCAQKTNTVGTVGTSSTGTPYSTGSATFAPGNPYGNNGTIPTQVAAVKSQVACLPGRNRLTNDVSFSLTNTSFVTQTTIGGSWQPGFMGNGTISDLFIGISAWGDILFVTKVSNGATVTGYNATMSFCELPNLSGPNLPYLIANNRPLVNFQAPSGISVGTVSGCGYGLVFAALNTTVISQRDPSNPMSFDVSIPTSFAAPKCP